LEHTEREAEMRLRMRRRNLVVWSSSVRQGVPAFARPARTTRIRRLIHTGALYAIIGLFRLTRAVRARRHGRLLLAGAVLTAAGIVLPSAMAVIAGTLILLRGVAVTLGVSDPRRRLDGAPGGADFFGFGTRPYPGPPGQNRT
jgi:hypothetical protein